MVFIHIHSLLYCRTIYATVSALKSLKIRECFDVAGRPYKWARRACYLVCGVSRGLARDDGRSASSFSAVGSFILSISLSGQSRQHLQQSDDLAFLHLPRTALATLAASADAAAVVAVAAEADSGVPFLRAYDRGAGCCVELPRQRRLRCLSGTFTDRGWVLWLACASEHCDAKPGFPIATVDTLCALPLVNHLNTDDDAALLPTCTCSTRRRLRCSDSSCSTHSDFGMGGWAPLRAQVL